MNKIIEHINQKHPGASIIPFCAPLEYKLTKMTEEEKTKYLTELGENVTS